MRYYSLILLFAWILSPANLMAQSYENSVAGDHKALMDIYHATDGKNWHNNDGWGGAPETMGNWWGVATDSNGRVIHLDLQRGTKKIPSDGANPDPDNAGNNLRNGDSNGDVIPGRELPESIGNLTKLKYLNLKQNSIRGPIPDGITNLVSLERLLLSGHPREPQIGGLNHGTASATGKHSQSSNWWTGHIPNNIGNMKSLVIFEVRQSGLSGSLPANFSQLTNLRVLLCSGHSPGLSGTIPPELGNLTKLENLQISGNDFEGELPANLGNMSGMKNFSIAGNEKISGLLPDLRGMTDLRVFRFSGTGISGPFPAYMLQDGRNPLINTFHVAGANLSGELPADINPDDYRHLRVLRLQGNNFEGEVPSWLAGLRSVIQLDISQQNFSGELPAEFSNPDAGVWKNIRTFRVYNNNLEGPLPDAPMGNDILEARFDGNNFSGQIPESWGKTDTGRDLTIRVERNNLSGEIPVELANINNLTRLNVSYNRFSDGDIDPLKKVISSKVDFDYSNQNVESGSDDGNGNEGDDGNSDDDNWMPDAPNNVSPANSSNNVSVVPRFEWSSTGADSYILNVRRTGSSQNIIYTEVEGTGFTPSQNLQHETTYRWRVRSVEDGEQSVWSSEWTFTTEKDSNSGSGGGGGNGKAPKKSSPSANEKNVSKKPTFRWESVEDAESYTIEISTTESSIVLIEEEVYDTLYTPGKDFQPNTKYEWRVRATINGNADEWSDTWGFTTVPENSEFEFETELSQNYPNPFNPTTQIRFTIPEAQQVSLKVYDMAGRLVANLVDNTGYSAGTHEVTFNANSLASGIYFYRFITESEIVTRKMTLMK